MDWGFLKKKRATLWQTIFPALLTANNHLRIIFDSFFSRIRKQTLLKNHSPRPPYLNNYEMVRPLLGLIHVTHYCNRVRA